MSELETIRKNSCSSPFSSVFWQQFKPLPVLTLSRRSTFLFWHFPVLTLSCPLNRDRNVAEFYDVNQSVQSVVCMRFDRCSLKRRWKLIIFLVVANTKLYFLNYLFFSTDLCARYAFSAALSELVWYIFFALSHKSSFLMPYIELTLRPCPNGRINHPLIAIILAALLHTDRKFQQIKLIYLLHVYGA